MRKKRHSFAIINHTKKNLYVLEFVNLFPNSNEFNERDFNFTTHSVVSSLEWYGDTVNEYDNMFSVATDVTEDNWRENFLDPHMLWGMWTQITIVF